MKKDYVKWSQSRGHGTANVPGSLRGFFDMSPLNAEAVKPHPKCHDSRNCGLETNNHDKTVGNREGEWGLRRLSCKYESAKAVLHDSENLWRYLLASSETTDQNGHSGFFCFESAWLNHFVSKGYSSVLLHGVSCSFFSWQHCRSISLWDAEQCCDCFKRWHRLC